MRLRPGDACEKILRRVEAAGSRNRSHRRQHHGRNSETYLRTRGDDPTKCLYCHESGEGLDKGTPMYNGIDMTGVRRTIQHGLGLPRSTPQNMERETHY